MFRKKIIALILAVAAVTAAAAPSTAGASTVPGPVPYSWHCC